MMRDIVTSDKLCFPPTRAASVGGGGGGGGGGDGGGGVGGDVGAGRLRVDISRGGGIVEQPLDLWSVAERFASRTESFIAEESKAKRPFFIYLALTHTHVPHTPASARRPWAIREHPGSELRNALGITVDRGVALL